MISTQRDPNPLGEKQIKGGFFPKSPFPVGDKKLEFI
jgi:hypothetical protein